MWLDGNVLHIDDTLICGNNRLTITDMGGRIIYSSIPSSAQLSLDRFPNGIYIASFGDAHLKVAVK